MEGHESMTIHQAGLAVVHRIGTVRAQKITWITTLCTISYRQPLSSIVAKHLLEVGVPICEPFLHGLASSAFSLVRFGVSFRRIVVLYISLVCSIFGEQAVGFRVWGENSQECRGGTE